MIEIELPGLRGLSRDGETLFFRGVPVKEMLAYPIALAAVLIGKSYWTVRREVHLGRLHQSRGAMIAKEELNRYLLDGRPAPGTSYAEQKLGKISHPVACDLSPERFAARLALPAPGESVGTLVAVRPERD